MASYDIFGKFYDAVMGDRADATEQLRRLIRTASPGAKNMLTFHSQLKFDVICCVFDSMNHVASFTHWKQLFGNVHQHLSAGGVFIFDINTQNKLDRHIAEPAWVHRFGDNFL